MGLGATLTFDLWALFLQHAFKITPSNICLVGRWLRYMPEGTFKHSNIASASPKSAECTIGWFAHYAIGVMFAIAFVASIGSSWLQHPTLIPAITFGVFTVAAPFFIQSKQRGSNRAAMTDCRIIGTAMRANAGAVSSSMTSIGAGTFGTHAASNTLGITQGSAAFDTPFFFHVTSSQ